MVEAPPPQRVTVATAVRNQAARSVRLSGTIEAQRTLALGFASPGVVEAVLVQEGDAVRGGQILARLSSRSAVDALGIAKAKAAQAEDAYRRLEPMYRSQTLPEIKWVEVETGRQQARLTVSMAEKNVGDTVLRAPEAGIVSRRSIEPGVAAAPGVPSITLVQTGTVLAIAPVPEMQIATVRVGQSARVQVAALGKIFEGTVSEVGVLADPLTRTYPVKIKLANVAGELRVGMVAEVFLTHANAGESLVVPPSSVRIDEGGFPCVFVVDAEGVVHRRGVTVAGYVGEGTALFAGVAEGDQVVTSGTPMLADGVKVTILERHAIEKGAGK